LVLLGCLGVTAPLELALKTRVYARWRKLLLAIAPSVVVFVAWDIYAIHTGQWTFNLDRMTGVTLQPRPGDGGAVSENADDN